MTVGDLLVLYTERRLPELRSWETTYSSLLRFLSPLFDRPACTLTGGDLAQEMKANDHAPAHAERALAYARAMFGWAVREGLMTGNPAVAIKLKGAKGLCIGGARLTLIIEAEAPWRK